MPQMAFQAPDELADKIKRAAAQEKRSVSNWIRLTLEERVESLDNITPGEEYVMTPFSKVFEVEPD